MKPHLREAYAIMRATWPKWAAQQDVQSARIWCEFLEDVPEADLLLAMRKLAVTQKWAPTVVEIREAAGAVDPETAARRQAAARAADRHAEWVSEQDRLATEEARERLRAAGVDPDSIGPGDVASLVKGIGH